VVKTVFVNPERCLGCRQCEFACAVEASQSKDPVAALSEPHAPHTRIHVEAGATIGTSFPSRCRHCDPAPCLQVCPTGAIYRDPDENVVLVDQARCIACAMCAIVCPFDAVTFHPAVGEDDDRLVATKCDGCVHLVTQGLEPACVAACMVDALVYGEINELVAASRSEEAERTARAAASTPADSGDRSASVEAWRSFGAQVKTIESR
jgi:anaerobic carbon-monoxide dehydrogenase iron sulfur subunit